VTRVLLSASVGSADFVPRLLCVSVSLRPGISAPCVRDQRQRQCEAEDRATTFWAPRQRQGQTSVQKAHHQTSL